MTASTTVQLLAEARAKLDQIDDRIFDLLRERAQIVCEVAEAKQRAGEESRSAFRPEREAQILRRLYQRACDAGGPDYDGLARIWREIMSAGLVQQAPVAVGVPQVSSERGLHLRRLAREQFGGSCEIHVYPAMGALYVAVRKDPNLIGIVPSLSTYLSLISGQVEIPTVFASLPFWGVEPGGQAFAFGHVRLAPSGDDITLVSISPRSGVGLGGCSALLSARGISAVHSASAGGRAVLSIEGYWADDRASQTLDTALRECCNDWRLIGMYARPLHIQHRTGARS